MKKIILFVILITIAITILAQSPQVFKYQTIVRDVTGGIMENQAVSFRISIHDGSAAGTIDYQEIHSTMTNPFGLAVLEIGNGSPPFIGTFSNIDWGSADKFLEVELDPTNGNNFTTMGASQLLSVPYAIHAETSADVVWDKNGDNIIYNGGNVGIGTNNPLEMLNVEGNAIADNLMATDSTLKIKKVYFTNSENGILIGDKYSNPLAKHNLLLNTSYAPGSRDVFTCQSLGNHNVALTVEGLGSNAFTGNDNVFIGHYTGYNLSNGSYNVFIGSSAGEHANPNFAVNIGCQTGDNNDGSRNTFIQDKAGYSSSGDNNIGIGHRALWRAKASIGRNIALGYEAGYDVDSDDNIFIGYQTGRDVTEGTGKNIFIGYEVGDYYNSGVASDILLIDNAQKSNKDYFIAGDMSSDTIAFNADINIYGKLNVTENIGIGISMPSEKIDVNGTAQMTGFKMPTGATNGYVLTSNASGAGAWMPSGAFNLPYADSTSSSEPLIKVINKSTGSAIYGRQNQGNFGILGANVNGYYCGVYGHGYSGQAGVFGECEGGGYGVWGKCTGGTGVFGESTHGTGVAGSGEIAGIYGQSSIGHAGYFVGEVYIQDNLGIGIDNPTAAISNSTTLSSDGNKNTSSTGINWRVDDYGGYAVGIENTATGGSGLLVDAGNNSGTGATVAHFVSNNNSLLFIGENGNIGINNITPARKLHINDVMRLEPRNSAPSGPSAGDLYFDGTTNKLRCYDGSQWQDCW